MRKPFKILALSGGGIRGIYQVVYLKKLSELLGIQNKDLYKQFDLICGTSTGAIVAMAVSMGVDLDVVEDLYINKGKEIFTKRNSFLSGFRKGSLYKNEKLALHLNKVFGNRTLGEAKTNVIITATSVSKTQVKAFTNFYPPSDSKVKITDALLSSSAAPIYFPPYKIPDGNLSYLDGGLWSNSPSGIAILKAQKYFNIHESDIRVLKIGTTNFTVSERHENLESMRMFSVDTIKKLINYFFITQENYDDLVAERLLGANFLKISSDTQMEIKLDDVKEAAEILPALAESEATQKIESVRVLLEEHSDDMYHHPNIMQLISKDLVEKTGLTAFYPDRASQKHRDSTGSGLMSYINMAQKKITLVSISLNKAIDPNDIKKALIKKIESSDDFRVTISLINPYRKELLISICDVFEKTPSDLKKDIEDAVKTFLDLKDSLAPSKKNNIRLRFHNSVPFASAILMDEDDTIKGRIQLETKAYKLRSPKSFAFEIMPVLRDGFFDNIKAGYNRLLNDGVDMSLEIKKQSENVTPKPTNFKKPKQNGKR